jgi:hypothetical protein
MKSLAAILLFLTLCTIVRAQDVIEREYFKGAKAKNAAIAAARYAEEGYYYTKFTTYVSAVDSSRIYADTALFFIKRSLMLGDTSLNYAPKTNYPAIDFLLSAKSRNLAADSIIREFYPMIELESHHYFGNEAALTLSNSVMDYFNASLLLRSDSEEPLHSSDQFVVLPYDDEIIRLEADEASFQQAANSYEREIEAMEILKTQLQNKREEVSGEKQTATLDAYIQNLDMEIDVNTSNLRDVSFRIQEIRSLLSSKYLEDVKNVEEPDHLSQFGEKEDGEIRMNEKVPEGLIYKIQLGYYPEDVNMENFSGLFPISGETVRDGLIRVYAGLFFTYTDADEGCDYVKNNAIANAFIVPFYNGEKVSMSRAVEIERQRGME